MYKATLIFFLSLFALCIGITHAQLQLPQSGSVSISSIPTDPAPLSSVQLVAQSYSFDLTQATLSWTYNGSVVAKGVGITNITVTAPRSGETATATVQVTGLDIVPVTASFSFSPGAVDLLWEPVDGYTPPFYKGRAALAHGGSFRVVAIAGKNAPRQLSYEWSENGAPLLNLSGIGKSSAIFQNTLFNTTESISVSAAGGAFEGTNKIIIAPKNPEIVAYQKKEGFIDYAKGAVNSLAISGPGAILRFEPFYFSVPNSILRNLSFQIKSGETESSGQDIPNEVGISRPANGGTSTISVIVNTVTYSLQNLSRLFTLTFN